MQVRLALLGTEIEFEKRRIFDAVLLGGISLILMGVGLILLFAFIVLMCPEVYRLRALGLMALASLFAGAGLMFAARQRLNTPAGLFRASITELKKDQAGLVKAETHENR